MKRWLVIALVGVLLVAAIGALTYINRPRPLPAVDASAVELVQFCVTDRFENLPEEKKYVYVEALMKQGIFAIILAANEAKLTEAQRQKGLENALQAGIQYRWGKHMDNWLVLDAKAKDEYVKKVAAEMPLRPPGMNTPGPASGQGGGRGGRFMSPARHKAFIENMPPERRAAMAEFMSQVQQAQDAGER